MRREDPAVEFTDVRDNNNGVIIEARQRPFQNTYKDTHVDIRTARERGFPQCQPVTKPVVLLSAGSNDRDSSSSSIMSYTPGELHMVELEIKNLLSGYKRLVEDASSAQRIGGKDNEWVTTTTTPTGSIKPESGTTIAALPISTPPPSHSNDVVDGVSTAMVSVPPPAATATTTTTTATDAMAVDGHGSERPSEILPGGVSGAAPMGDRGLHSTTSLPVSSVRGEHSTDANTPTPSLQMPKQITSVRENGTGEGGKAEDGVEAHVRQPMERMSSPVDLFADALTEDHLNRSFEMQLQRRQQEMEWARRQKQLRQGIPVIHMMAACNANGRLRWNSMTSSVDGGINHPAVWRATGTPVPPFVRQAKISPHESGNSDEENYHLRESYISTAAAAAVSVSTHHYPTASLAEGADGSLVYRPAGHEMSGNGVMHESSLLGGESMSERIGVAGPPRDAHASSNQARAAFSAHDESSKAWINKKQYSIVLKEAEVEEEEEEERPSQPLPQQHQRSPEQRHLRNRSRHRGNAVDSMTPEIATSPRRTENPSMRSGFTGSRRMTGAAGAVATGAGTAARHMLNEMRYSENDDVWKKLEADGGLAFITGGQYRLTEETGFIGGYRGQQEHHHHHHQPKQRGRKNHRPQGNAVEYEQDSYPMQHHRHRSHPQHQSAVIRFHNIIERRVAALEGNPDTVITTTTTANTTTRAAFAMAVTTELPSFADSLVGAAISDLCPVVKRRQAQLKESQLAEAAAAAAADATRIRILTRPTYKSSVGTVTSTPSTTPTPSTHLRCSRGSWAPPTGITRRQQQRYY